MLVVGVAILLAMESRLEIEEGDGLFSNLGGL